MIDSCHPEDVRPLWNHGNLKATTETFFTKGIDAVGKFQDSTDDKIRNGFKNSAKIQDKMFSFVEEKVAPRVQKLKSKKSKK